MSRIDQALRRFSSHEGGPVPYVPPGGATAVPYVPPAPLPTASAQIRDESPDTLETLDLRQLAWVLYERIRLILIVMLGVVAPVALMSFLAEPLYRSTAAIHVDAEPVQVLPFREVDRPVSGNTSGPGYELFVKSQEQILRGPSLVLRVGERLESSSDAATRSEVPKLWERYSAQRVPGTQIFHVSYLAPVPEMAATVANTFAEEYIKLHFESGQKTREDARQLLERELHNLEQRVETSEAQLLQYSQQNNIGPAGPLKGQIPEKLTSLEQQLTAVESQIFVAQAKIDSLKDASPADFPERLVTPQIAALISQQLQLENSLTALRANFGENWPDVVTTRGQLEMVRQQIDREKRGSIAQALEQANLEYRAAENQRRMVASALSGQRELANRLENATIEYNILQREVQTNQKMYDGLLERLRQTSVTAGMEFAGVRIVEPAFPTDEVASPRILWNIALAAILGFALGVCLVVARQYWDTSVTTIEEVERVTALPVLGAVPRLQKGISSFRLPAVHGAGMLLTAGDANGALPVGIATPNLSTRREASESVRNVVASILLSRSERPPRVIVVTSAVQGEGKTMFSCELAWALAESGAKTLLVEGDLRRPSFRTRFGLGDEGGLSLFLAGHLTSTPALHSTDLAALSVVVAGPAAPNPAALLGSERMQEYVRQMAASFQFVIIDSPPVLPVADARLLARMADGVTFVTRAGHAPRVLVQRAIHALQSSGVNLLGVVLNGVERGRGGSAYYHFSYLEYYGS